MGEFKNGLPHGQCTFTTRDGTTYVGEFKEGLYHGHGKINYPDGREWEGEWQNDLPVPSLNSRGVRRW